ncbi:MAG: aminodeoxychorismate/anthranilate synthase component II [Bacteroidetes bacterium]|nr:aminodeoxychorismate/anthranilate synthase component II [Bacteroidota bacterium]
MSLLLLDNNDSFTFNIVNILRTLASGGFEVVKSGNLNEELLSRFDRVIISPGPGKSSEFPAIEKTIKHCIQQSKPLLGICLGHQAICEYFGAELYRMTRVLHGHKKLISIDNKTTIFKTLPDKIEVGLYHSWAIKTESLPSCLQISAETDEGILMAVRHKEQPIFGVQFHPESFLSKYGNIIIDNFLII